MPARCLLLTGKQSGSRLSSMVKENLSPVTYSARIGKTNRASVWVLTALTAIVVFLSQLLFAAPVAGQAGNGQTVELSARAGYDGYYKSEFWLPIRVIVTNDGPLIEGHLQVISGSSSGNDQVIYRSSISSPTSSIKAQTLYVHIPSFADEFTVELVDESGQIVESTQTNRLSGLADDALLYAVVTGEPGRLEYLETITAGRSEAAVAYLGLAEIPDVAAALNAVDVVIFHGIDTGRLTAGQREALESWLDTGGQMVVTGGPAWQETTAGLEELLPVTISGVKTVDNIPVLLDYGKLAFRDPGPYLVTDNSLRNGEILLHQDGTPLLARQGHGRGSVFFLALDPSLAPLLDWRGSQAVWSMVASNAQPVPVWAHGARHSYAATSAVSSLPVADLPAAWALFIFLMFYVVLVGPINYVILRRLGRRELAWLTIPLLVLIFSATAYVVGFGLKGNETIINQMSIVYGHTDGEQARVQTLIGLYSPRRASYDLQLPAEAIPRPFERSFGAMGGQGNIEAINRAGTITISDIRVDVGSVETLVADSYQPMPDVTGSVRLRTSAGNVHLDIDIYNNSSVTLENATLLAGSMAVPLGDLAPGNSISHSVQVTGSSASSPPVGPTGIYVPSPHTTSPLLANAETLLGTADYYNDRRVFPRWQLIQAMAPEYVIGGQSTLMPDVFTLVAWTEQPQLDLSLPGSEYNASATSLYFLELPARREFSGQGQMVIPRQMLNWLVIAEQGVYDARVDDLFLPQGSVEFEFEPWSELRSLKIDDLFVVLQPPAGSSAQQLPQVLLWDWDEASWRTAGDPAWGRIAVEDPARYVGPDNAVRLQLANPGPVGINIGSVYPELSGSFE